MGLLHLNMQSIARLVIRFYIFIVEMNNVNKDIYTFFVRFLKLVVVKLIVGILHLHIFCQLLAIH